MLMQQDVGFILVKDLAQSQEDNLEQKSEPGESNFCALIRIHISSLARK